MDDDGQQRWTKSHFFDSASALTPKSFAPHLLLCKSWKYSRPTRPWLCEFYSNIWRCSCCLTVPLMESVVYFATCGKPLLELLWLWLRGGQTMGFGPHLACQITYTFFQATCFWLWTVVQCCCIANCTVSSLPVVRQSRIQSSSQKFHHLCFSWHIGWSCHMLVLFQSQTKMFLKWLKKIKPFQSECLKIQANEHCYGNQQILIQLWDEWPKCLSKKWLKCLSEKNTHMTCSVCMTWHPHQLSPTCMDECYHGFSVGKLLAVSCLCCLNYKPSC